MTDLAAAIRADVTRIILDAEAARPRSLQTTIGPSGYGHPCKRRVAYETLNWPTTNASDLWRAIVGTSVHAHLERNFGACDEPMPDGQLRFVLEERVQAAGAPAGSCDVLDRKLRTIYDWKTAGPTRIKEARRGGIGDQYRVQAHTYGAGWVARGELVENVAVVFLPRNGDLKDMHVWTEPYDPTVVEKAVERWQGVISAASTLDVENHPERFALIAAEPSRLCGWCPYFRALSTDPANGCPGNTADLSANGLLMRPTRTSPSTTGTKETAA